MGAIVVKCDQCNALFHLKCTAMPVHMGIKYFTSRVTYTSEQCVQTKTDVYDDVLKLLNDQGGNGQTSDDVMDERGAGAGAGGGAGAGPPVNKHAYRENRDSFGLTEKFVESTDELRTQMNTLSQKINNENNGRKPKLYSSLEIDR